MILKCCVIFTRFSFYQLAFTENVKLLLFSALYTLKIVHDLRLETFCYLFYFQKNAISSISGCFDIREFQLLSVITYQYSIICSMHSSVSKTIRIQFIVEKRLHY